MVHLLFKRIVLVLIAQLSANMALGFHLCLHVCIFDLIFWGPKRVSVSFPS